MRKSGDQKVGKSSNQKRIKVTIDPESGFCFGVSRAVGIAENELGQDPSLLCLGSIVHNEMEVKRLNNLGLQTTEKEEFRKIHGRNVLIRAHGEPPETYRTASENNIRLIDATCPIVLKLQKKIRQAYIEMVEKKGQVVIYGKKGHAEVIGLEGHTDGNVIVIEDENDLDKINFNLPIRLFAQTTMSPEGFQKIAEAIRERLKQIPGGMEPDFTPENTICRQVSNRSGRLSEFVRKFEIILFVSGKKSSNGLSLYEFCKKVNSRTYFVSGIEDIRREWFTGVKNAGICGATSTPKWLMEQIAGEVKKISLD